MIQILNDYYLGKTSSMTQKGFTLIELLVVVAIIGIISAVGIVSYNGFVDKAKDSKCLDQHRTVSNHVGGTIVMCKLSPNSRYSIGPKFPTSDWANCSDLYVSDDHTNTMNFVHWTQTYDMKNSYNGYGCCGHAWNRDPYIGETYIQNIAPNKIRVVSRCGGSIAQGYNSGELIYDEYNY